MANFAIADPFWQYHIPEYELEGYWYCSIVDGSTPSSSDKHNSFSANTYVAEFDKYIQSVSIPQKAFSYENTEYGMISFKEKSPYDDVTLSCYDDIEGNCFGFFLRWMDSIFDEKKNALKSNWRYEAKDIIVSCYRILWGKTYTIKSYRMIKCLPKSLAEVSQEEDAGSRKTFSVMGSDDLIGLTIIDSRILHRPSINLVQPSYMFFFSFIKISSY